MTGCPPPGQPSLPSVPSPKLLLSSRLPPQCLISPLLYVNHSRKQVRTRLCYPSKRIPTSSLFPTALSFFSSICVLFWRESCNPLQEKKKIKLAFLRLEKWSSSRKRNVPRVTRWESLSQSWRPGFFYLNTLLSCCLHSLLFCLASQSSVSVKEGAVSGLYDYQKNHQVSTAL